MSRGHGDEVQDVGDPKGMMRMDLEQDVWRALAHARAHMHEISPIVEVDDLAVMLGHTRAEIEPVLQRLEAQGYLLIQLRPGRVPGTVFATQDGVRVWAQRLLDQGEEPLPDFQRFVPKILECLERQPLWTTDALAAEVELAVTPLTAQLRVMEMLGMLRANKRGSGVILSVRRPD